jgi:hypothetical protein
MPRPTLNPSVTRRLTRQLARQLAVAWAIVDASTLHLVTVCRSRAEARKTKKPGQRLVRVDLRVAGLKA